MSIYLKRCLEHHLLGPVISQNVVALMKRELMEIQFTSFPSYLIYGEPGTGKTPVANATTLCREDLNLDMPHARLCDALERLKYEAVNLDDCAELKSSLGKQRQYQNLDSAVRRGYEGTGSVLTVTAETNAIRNLPNSALMRMIPLGIGSGLNESELAELVTFLQTSDEFVNFMKKFRVFFETKLVDYESKLRCYRQTNPNQGGLLAKRVDMVFCYHMAMELLVEFCSLEEKLSLDSERIATIENGLLSVAINDCSTNREELTERVVEYVIANDLLKPQIPNVHEMCKYYLRDGCDDYSGFFCQDDEDNDCSRCRGFETAIDPSSIALRLFGGTNAILISNPQMLYSFRHDYEVPPFLIIEKNTFEIIMNHGLCLFCEKEGRKALHFKEVALKKDLHAFNRIMVTPNADKGYRFTHPFVGVDEYGNEQKIRVVLLMLRKEEAEYLENKFSQEVTNGGCERIYIHLNSNHSVSVNLHILKNWIQSTFYVGARVGEYVKSFD